jgi:hypothetical protein
MRQSRHAPKWQKNELSLRGHFCPWQSPKVSTNIRGIAKPAFGLVRDDSFSGSIVHLLILPQTAVRCKQKKGLDMV